MFWMNKNSRFLDWDENEWLSFWKVSFWGRPFEKITLYLRDWFISNSLFNYCDKVGQSIYFLNASFVHVSSR